MIRYPSGLDGSIDEVPRCCTSQLDASTVLRENNVQIPEDDVAYFYIKIILTFSAKYISDFNDITCFLEADEVESGEETKGFMIPRDNLLSDCPRVVEDTICQMLREMGMEIMSVACSVIEPIQDMAHQMDRSNRISIACERQSRRSSLARENKVLAFSAQIFVTEYVDIGDSDEEEDGNLIDIENEILPAGDIMLSDTEEMEDEEMNKLDMDTEVETCAICQNGVTNDVKRMSCCKNEFHDKCIKKWMKINSVCPLCRVPILP